MAKCDSKGFVIRQDQMGKLKNDDMIAISVLDSLASCAKIDTRNNTAASNSNLKDAFYNAANTPVDAFGCSKNTCYNTGTYQGAVVAKNPVFIGDFKKTFDVTLYATGIITVYFLLPDGDHNVSINLTDYTAGDWTNYDTLTKTVHATKGGNGSYLYPVQFDLSKAPTVTGSGWTPSTIGIKARFMISNEGVKANDYVGVSSIAFYESIEDLELNRTILLSCLDTFGDSQSFDVIEGACSTSEYDPKSGSITFNLTANKWSENLKYINPTLRKTDDTEFGVLNIVTRTVGNAKTINAELNGYGFIQLSDMVENDCGYVYIQTPGCAGNSHDLVRVNSPVPTIDATTDSDKFQVLTSDYLGNKSLGLILVGKDWIGQELNIIYRKKVTAEVWEVTNEFREFNVSILAPFRKKDGTREWHLYENAFVTTVPNSISRSDETTVELEFTVAADENGVRKKIAKITEA